jgi:hypothetical protein
MSDAFFSRKDSCWVRSKPSAWILCFLFCANLIWISWVEVMSLAVEVMLS